MRLMDCSSSESEVELRDVAGFTISSGVRGIVEDTFAALSLEAALSSAASVSVYYDPSGVDCWVSDEESEEAKETVSAMPIVAR